jgi:winged helix DNA-binding protein
VAVRATRAQVLAFRARAQQLDREHGTLAATAVLDLGVQDTGPDGGRWALAVRGVETADLTPDDLVTVWSLRGAPHLYRRGDLPGVAAAVQPFSDDDAAKRIYDAAKPLRAAGIGIVEALDVIAARLRSVVTGPTVKGEVSARLTELSDPPYLRFCRPCDATHVYEMPFRLAALRAGLELQPGTSPPVLQPVAGLVPAAAVPPHLDVVRGYLRLLGPATPQDVAGYLDAPVRDVKRHWPADVVEVGVDDRPGSLLAADADALAGAAPVPGARLLGPFDPFLQARDRGLLVSDPARAKALWPVLGRPGAVLLDGEVAGTWRPRQTSGRLRVLVDLWRPVDAHDRAAVEEQVDRLARHRGVALAGVDLGG